MSNSIEHFDLQKTRLCSAVVLTWATGNQDEFKKSEKLLKEQLGTGSSATSAFQFMSGKRAKAALECGLPEEQLQLLTAHHIAKEVCAEYGLGAVNKPDQIDRTELLALVKSRQYALQ